MFKKSLALSTLLLLCLFLVACIAPLPEALGSRDVLFQASTLSSLSAGNFDGTMTIAELKRHGDFGLGTYNALDGEMVMLDGQTYRVREDGVPTLAEDSSQTPFAAVTFFEPDQTFVISDTMDCPQLQAQVDSQLPTLDAPYAIEISGEFDQLEMRAPHRQSQP
jgi:acetolactate decarboxylase